MCMSHVLYCVVLCSIYLLCDNHKCGPWMPKPSIHQQHIVNALSNFAYQIIIWPELCVCERYFHTMSTQHIIAENEATILTYPSLSLSRCVNTNIRSIRNHLCRRLVLVKGNGRTHTQTHTYPTKMHNSSFRRICHCKRVLE